MPGRSREGPHTFLNFESCKLLGHNPWEYLNDVCSILDESPMKIEDLTPLNWKKVKRV